MGVGACRVHRVAADVVALDTELPLKSRDSLETASGDIPKLGMKLYLTEKQMKDVDAMIAQGLPVNRIIDNIFADIRCIDGVWERIEDIFLSELSSGVGVAAHSGATGVRIDMNFYEANQFAVSALWSKDDSTPLDDIQKIFDKALEDGNTITEVFLDDTALQLLYKNKQVRAQFAYNNGVAMTGTTSVPVLDLNKVKAVFLEKWNVTVTAYRAASRPSATATRQTTRRGRKAA